MISSDENIKQSDLLLRECSEMLAVAITEADMLKLLVYAVQANAHATLASAKRMVS